MTTSSNVPLERVPHLWSADVKALREIGIASAGDLVQSVHENGLKSISDSSGIPPEPLHEYLTAAEAFVSEAVSGLFRWAHRWFCTCQDYLPCQPGHRGQKYLRVFHYA